MPPADDQQAAPDGQEPAAPAPGTVSLSPSDVKNSPEYRALQRQAREEARRRGDAEAALSQFREAQAAAEAERLASQEARIRELLGPDGTALWNNLADLSASDPVAAAELLSRTLAQSQGAATPPPAAVEPAPTEGEAPVTTPAGAAAPPPPMPSGAAASAPITPPESNPWDAIIDSSQRHFDEVVERNQNPMTRNRVTMRDRGAAMMSFLLGSYAKAFKERG